MSLIAPHSICRCRKIVRSTTDRSPAQHSQAVTLNLCCDSMHDLSAQGRRVTGSQEDLEAGFSFGDFNAYADLGLYSEDSSSSSSSGSRVRFLQPVPSLPGLAEPVHGHLGSVTAGAKQAGCSSTVTLAKQQGIKPSSSNLCPTKHHAWRQMHTPLATGVGLHLLSMCHDHWQRQTASNCSRNHMNQAGR